MEQIYKYPRTRHVEGSRLQADDPATAPRAELAGRHLVVEEKVDGANCGMSFGIQSVVPDQHVLQRGRIGRLISTAWATGLPGVGLDADTGARLSDEARLSEVPGLSTAFVVDLQTYGASGAYAGPSASLSLRRAVTHLIPAGGFGYDLAQRRPLLGSQPLPAPSIAGLGVLAGEAIEPRLLPERRWGQLYNLIAGPTAPLGLGIDVGTAVEIAPQGAAV